ncbi:ATP-binding protein [Corynebacterium mastitidis]|uniref:ATP-binding protein n=1 Tax=Corynebacterium mastitidis TaxID=161890 RepID=UPI0003A11EF9|nr:ATP-binding protein [Corynebacterium mastitidis]
MTWTLEELERRLTELRHLNRDTTEVEVKRASRLPENLPESICAFANMPDGGTVILGISEEDNFSVEGIEDAPAMLDAVISQTRTCVVPAPQLEAKVFTLNGKDVVVVHVASVPLSVRPARYKNRAYLRQSDGDYVMNDSDLALIEIQKLAHSEHYRFDVAPVFNSGRQDLDSDAVGKFLSSARAQSQRLSRVGSDSALLEMLNIVTGDDEVTLSGLYALGMYPQAKAPQLRITAAVQTDHNGRGIRNRNRRDFDGPLPDLLEDAVAWVGENAPRYGRYVSSGNMVEECVYPLGAVRELIANALVHRDLSPNSEGKWVEIRIKGDRLIITNPGGLRGVSTQQLESAALAKNAVNPRLYDIAKRVRSVSGSRVIEGEGAGVQEVFAQAREAGLPKPTLIDTGVQFTAIMYGTPAGEENGPASPALPLTEKAPQKRPLRARNNSARVVTKNGDAIMKALTAHGSETDLDQLVASTNLTEGQVRYAVEKLMSAGLVRRNGGWGVRGTTYTLL